MSRRPALAFIAAISFATLFGRETKDIEISYSVDMNNYILPSKDQEVRIVADFFQPIEGEFHSQESKTKWLEYPKQLSVEQSTGVLALLGNPVLLSSWPRGLIGGPAMRIEYVDKDSGVRVVNLRFYFHEGEGRFLCMINNLPFALQDGKEFRRIEVHPYYQLFEVAGRDRWGLQQSGTP